jgi:hypothetical protein
MVRPMLQGSLRTLAVLSLGLFISPAALAQAQADQPGPAPTPADAADTAPAEETAGESGEASAEVRPAEAPDAAMDEARRRYAQGSEYYRRGRYAEAVAEFSEAYSLWPNPVILYALGQAYEGQSDANRAIETYQRFLEVAPEGDLRRQDAELHIEALRGLLAVVHVVVNVQASIVVDGEVVGAAPGDVRLPTGRHVLELRADGYHSQTAAVTIAGGTERTVSFELEPLPTAGGERERFRFPRPAFYTAVGLTGAGVVVWGAMASTAVVRARDYNDTPGRTNFDREEARDVAERSNVALGVVGGLAVTTLVIGLLTDWGDDEEPDAPLVTASVTPLQGGAMVSARWTR